MKLACHSQRCYSLPAMRADSHLPVCGWLRRARNLSAQHGAVEGGFRHKKCVPVYFEVRINVISCPFPTPFLESEVIDDGSGSSDE